MNKILVFLFLSFSAFFQAQIISGIIKNGSENPLSEVNIYVDGSQIFTTSNVNGNFSIDVQNQGNAILVFQKSGFETATFDISKLIGKKVNIVLDKVQDIEEVVLIPYTDEAYRKFIKYFLDQFIGFDQANVKIKNQKTLKFAFDKQNQILKVKATEPLIINNKKLAYQIQYNLMNFRADFKNKTVGYLGTSFFKEIDEKKLSRVHRLNAYHGNIMHFLRSAYQNRVYEEGFWVNHVVKMDKNEIISTNKPMALIATKISTDSYMQTNGNKRILVFDDILQVNYPKNYFEIKKGKISKGTSVVQQTSYIYVDGNSFEIYSDGNSSDPENMILQGNFSGNKMENFLPLDYLPTYN